MLGTIIPNMGMFKITANTSRVRAAPVKSPCAPRTRFASGRQSQQFIVFVYCLAGE